MTLALVSPTGDRRFLVPAGRVLCVGREPSVELPLLDAGVSRRHAELTLRTDAAGERLSVRDLGSRNGTWRNGARLAPHVATEVHIGDLLAFGAVELVVVDELPRAHAITEPFALDGAATMVQERAMRAPADVVERVAGRRLSQLVALAQRLGGLASGDALLGRLVSDAFEAFDADRAAVLIADADGTLVMRTGRDRDGRPLAVPVPRSIVRGVADRQVSWMLHDAASDARAAGESVVRQAVRSALAAPLIGEGRRTLGVLYVDNLRSREAFTEADLDFLVAYAGIAAAAVERELAAERLRDAERVRENFGRYFTPQLAERIAAERGAVQAGGERRPVVVLFADVRGFTAIAESLAPDALAAQLSEHFAAMVECVFAEEGALDKFIGDAVMAYWGAPVAFADDAARAVRAACAMQRALAACNARWRAEGRPALAIGVGVHAGEVFVGNVGAPNRLEYTLIGDAVNVASRLCDAAGAGEVLVSDAVRDALPADVREALVARPEVTPMRRSGAAIGVWSVSPAQEAEA